MNESFKVYAICIWAAMGLVSAVICVLRVKRELEVDSLAGVMVSADPGPKPWHYKLRRNVVLPLLMAALAFAAWPVFLAVLAWDKGLNVAAWWPRRNQLKHATLMQPDEETLEVMNATGFSAFIAKRFIRSAPPGLIQRLLDRHAARLSSQPCGQAAPYPDRIRHDPLEEDPVKGPIIRRVLDETSREMTAEHGHEIGLCHRIWHETQKRLLQEYSIVWYCPREVNPFCRFD